MAPPNSKDRGSIHTRERARKIAQGRMSAVKAVKWRILSFTPTLACRAGGESARYKIATASISVTIAAKALRSFDMGW